MDPGVVSVFIPVISVIGLFAWLIARTVTKAYTAAHTAKLHAQGGDRDEILAAVDGLRREVADLAERVDFAERLLAKPRDPERLARGST